MHRRGGKGEWSIHTVACHGGKWYTKEKKSPENVKMTPIIVSLLPGLWIGERYLNFYGRTKTVVKQNRVLNFFPPSPSLLPGTRDKTFNRKAANAS